MDSFVFRNLDSGKSHSHHRFPKITDVFRYIEICVVVFVLLWFSTKLPFNFSFVLESFQDVCQFLLSPRFVFLVGNAIVLTLFVKSGQFSSENSGENSSDSSSSGGDVYDEYVKNSARGKKIRHQEIPMIHPETPIHNSNPPPPENLNDGEANSILDMNSLPAPLAEKQLDDDILPEKTVNTIIVKPEVAPNADRATKSKNYQRSRSEYTKREKAAPAKRELRRSKTEKSKDEMSNEEFQQTIEEFIARQVKFIREESMAVVLKK